MAFIQTLVAATEGYTFWLELRLISNDKEQHIAALITEEQIDDNKKYNFKEVRAYTTQTMTDNLVLMVTSLVTIIRRTMIIEGNTVSALPKNIPVTTSEGGKS